MGDALERLLAPFLRTRCGVPGRLSYSLVAAKGPENRHHALYRDCSVRAHDTSWARLGDALFAELNLHAIEGFAEFAVHAGVVAEGDRVIAFPAESEAGKSTMTAACLGTGFQYVSDEALCVDFASGEYSPIPSRSCCRSTAGHCSVSPLRSRASMASTRRPASWPESSAPALPRASSASATS